LTITTSPGFTTFWVEWLARIFSTEFIPIIQSPRNSVTGG
jgi:hypothetical protein